MDAPLPSIDNSVDGTGTSVPSATILASMENATFIMPTDDGMQGQDMSQTTLYTMEQVNLPPDGMVDQRTEFHSNVFLIANPAGSEGFDGTQYLSADQQCLYVVDPSMTQTGNIGIVDGATFNLVEMAPMAMASNTEHTYRYDTGTHLGSDDVISDAQAAELLMKVSESRTHDIPYVHVQLSHNSEGYTQLVEVPMENGGALLGSGYQPMVCVQPMMQGTWTTHSVMDTTTTTTKYSDIVSASMEAISFPESAPTTINLASISQAFPEFDENTATHSEKIKPLPRPVRSRESIEARINRLLRGQNTEDASKPVERPPEKPTTSSWSSPLCKPTPPRIIPSTLKPAIKPPKPRHLEAQPAATTPPAAKKKKIIMHMDGIDLPLEVNMTDDTQINLPMDPQPAPQNTGTNVDDDLQIIQRGNNMRTREVWHNTGIGKYAIKVGMRTIQTSSALLKHRNTPETRSEQVANMSFSDELDTAGEIEIEYYYSATTPKNAPPPQVKVIVPVKPFPAVASPPQPQTTTKPFASYAPRARGVNKRLANSAAASDPNLPASIDLSDSVPEDELNVRLPWMKPIEEEQERPKTRDFLTRTRRSVTNDSAPVVKVYGIAQPNLSRIQPKPISTCMSSVAEEEEELDHQQTETEPVTAVQSLEIGSALETSVNEVEGIMQPEPESRVPEVTDSQGEQVVETVEETISPGAEVRVRTPSPVWPSLCKGEDDLESGLRFTVTKTYTRQRPPKKRKKSALFLVSDDEDEEDDDDRGEDDSENVDPQTSENPVLDEEPKEGVEAEASVQDISPQVYGVENGDVKESGETENSKDGCANETEASGTTGDHKNQIRTDGEEKKNDNSKEMEKKRERSSSSSLSKNKSDKHRSKSDEQQIRHSSSDRVPGTSSKPCPKCHERFTTSTGFLKHVAKHGVMERRLTCLLCKWESKGNVKLLEGHILKKHKNKLPS